MSKKICILMMSCNNDFFDAELSLMKDAIGKDVPDIDIMYYTGGWKDNMIDGDHIKCDAPDGLEYTMMKTAKAIWMILDRYDYVLRTNTSTWVNTRLLRNIVDNGIINDDYVYGSDIYALSEAKAPYPCALYARGNCILASSSVWKTIVIQSIQWFHYNIVDDVAIGNIWNSHCLAQYNDIHVKGLPHAWYRCSRKGAVNRHSLCGDYGMEGDASYYMKFLTVQLKMYRKREYEMPNIVSFTKMINESPAASKLDLEYVRRSLDNFDIFIGSCLGYITKSQYDAISVKQLVEFEIAHKAIDDKENPDYDPERNHKLHYVPQKFNKN